MKNITKALREGELVVGTCCDISDPSVVEIIGRCGWDFVIINAEGGTVSPFGDELENMIRAAYAVDVTPVVKIPENNDAMIATCVKFGAKAVLEGPQVLKCFVYKGLQGLEGVADLTATWIRSAKKTMYRPMHVISSS